MDAIVDEWRTQRPELDTRGKHVTGRVIRLATLCEEQFDAAHAETGLVRGDFGILSPLRRAGEPYQMSPTEIARHRMITSGGLTPALDRLERRGLIERVANERDRRSRLVRLTPQGVATIDRAIELHTEVEQRLVAGLDAATYDGLVDGLRSMLGSMESD